MERLRTALIGLAVSSLAASACHVSPRAPRSGVAPVSCEGVTGGALTSGLARVAPSYAVTFVRVRDSAAVARAVGQLAFRRLADTVWAPAPGDAAARGRQFLGGSLRLPMGDLGIPSDVQAAPLDVMVVERQLRDSLGTGRPVAALIFAAPGLAAGVVSGGDAVGLRVLEVTDGGLRGVWRADRGASTLGGGYFCAVAP